MSAEKPSTYALSSLLLGPLLWLGAGTCAAQTEALANPDLRLSGFGTIGVSHTDAPAGWGFLRDIDQPGSPAPVRADIDSRLGVQINYTATPQLEFIGQVLAKRRLPSADASEAVEWAMAAYRPRADLTLRVGRINVDQFLMSDYRNVGFAYVYARPPVEYYGAIPTALDGADITKIWDTESGRWRAKGFAGRTQVMGMGLRPVLSGTVSYETGGLLVRAGLSRTRFANPPPVIQPLIDGLGQLATQLQLPAPTVAAEAEALRDRLDFTGEPILYGQVGISYEQAPWHWSAEVTRLSAGPNFSFLAGHVSLSRRLGPVTVFGVLSGAKPFASPVAMPDWITPLTPIVGDTLAQQAQFVGTLAAQTANRVNRQHTLSLGARWDLHAQLALKLQWDHVRIKPDGGILWSNATPAPARADVGSLVLDFVF